MDGDAATVQSLLPSVTAEQLVQQLHGRTALVVACQGGHDSCVELLLAHGAAYEQVMVDTYCAGYPLHALFDPYRFVSIQKRRRCIELLLQHHAEEQLRLVNGNGWTAFYSACRDGDAEIVELLLRHIPLEQIQTTPTDDNSTPLGVACMWGNVECVKLMLAHDPPRVWMNDARWECVDGLYEDGHIATGAYRCLVMLIVHDGRAEAGGKQSTKVVKFIASRVHAAAKRIQHAWRVHFFKRVRAANCIKRRLHEVITNPEFDACKRRLWQEWCELSG